MSEGLAEEASKRHAARVALLSVLSYVAFSVGVPLLSLPHLPGPWIGPAMLLATMTTTIAFMLLQLWIPRALVRLRMPAFVAAVAAGISLAAWAAFLAVVNRERGMEHAPWSPLLVIGVAGMGTSLTVGLSCLGLLLSRIIREPNVLLPVAFVAMPIDYMGAMTPTGYTANMVKHHPNIVQHVSVLVPHVHGVEPVGFIGPGDILFIAFFLCVVQRLSMNEPGTFRAMFLLLTATLLVVAFRQVNIAALVPMGLAVLIANFRFFKLQRSEVFATIYAALIVTALAYGFYQYSHHFMFGGK